MKTTIRDIAWTALKIAIIIATIATVYWCDLPSGGL